MEKFAIDLDKVLDDFEFNEDCAEQIAAVSCASGSSTTSGIKCSSSSSLKDHNSHIVDPAKTSKGFEVMSNFEKHKDPQQITIENRPLSTEKDLGTGNLNYSKGDSTLENIDSVNHFYPLDCVNENKVMHKQCVQAQDLEQVSLTIYNDISQKLLQKQQNGDTSPKIQNRYDKKLNQPNIKPSVSNVFNSLNEYINAPTVNLSYVDTMLDKQEGRPKKQSDTYGIAPTKNSVKECNLTKNVSADGMTCLESEETDNSVSHSKNPHYDNISVPLSLPSHIQGKMDLKVPESLERICSMDCSRTISKEQHDTTVLPQSTTDAFEHRYENICPGSSMQGMEQFNIQVDKSDSQKLEHTSSNVKHTYENVNLDENKVDRQSDKEPSTYQNVYIEKQDTLQDSKTQTTTYKVPDYVPSKEFETEKHSCMHTAKQISLQSGSSTSQPDASSKHAHPTQQVHKPAGFGHIDDLSEEELTKYLAELEAEEALREENLSYQNIALPEVHNKPSSTIDTFQFQQDDEDANEAPIFESVMIGELPSVSEEELQEKAKKFPIIDYSKGSVVGRETLGDFLEKPSQEKPQDLIKPVCIEKGNKENVKRTKKLGDDTVINLRCTTENISHNENVPSVQEISGKNNNLSMVGTVSVNESVPESSHLQESQSSIIESQMTHDTFNSISADKNVTEQRTLFCTSLNNEEQSGLQENKTNDTDSHTETLSNDLEPTVTNGKQSELNVDIDKPVRPQTLDIVLAVDMDEQQNAPGHDPGSQERVDIEANKENGQAPSEPSPDISDNSFIESGTILGKQPPFWIPDGDASSCMLCDVKFTVLKRRHHCRACGKVLCNKCCNMKFRLEYQGNIDSRVCVPCHQLLIKAENGQTMGDWPSGYTSNTTTSDINSPQGRQPNPNNPMEYCSTIPPLQQLAGGLPPPPTVMVPVGVLKREGSTKQRPEGSKSVMFSDGIRPGCDLTELDTSWDLKAPYRKSGSKRISTSGSNGPANTMKRQNIPPLDSTTNSYIPQDSTLLPPTVTIHKGQVSYHTVTDLALLYKTLKNECEPPVMFAINRNLYAYVKITNLNCCVNKVCWNITSRGLACVGQDEVILLVETLPDENHIPKDLLIYINQIYIEAIKGNTITELGFSVFQGEDLLGSREHAGFLFIRQTLQCLQKIVLPPAPFLVGLLIHRWETPWAKIFPLRLILRLGAEYRYYPCPLVSVRFRNALYFEIGHTVMKLLADFRNYGYTLPGVRGLTIHLKNRTTDVMFPRNRYDQVIKGLNNSNDHVLAYASNFSITADSHLVCIQTNTGDESNYQTQAINIHNKPRTVTGASFIVINGALKSSMGLSAKSSIVEDGLMVEIMPEKMEALKAALKNMQDFSIGCGRQGASDPDETVNIKWIDNDTQFNLGVRSPIDGLLMDGIPSIRVHNGIDYKGTSRIIRWTEVFIIKSDDHPNAVHDPVDINKLSENIARATCAALVKLLDLLATAGLTKLGVRTTIHPDNVGYEAGSEGTKLPPIYMNSLDNELIQVLHKAAQSNQDTCTVLELIFYILDD